MIDGEFTLQLVRCNDRRAAVGTSRYLVAMNRLDAIGFHDSGDPLLAARLADLPQVLKHTTLPVDTAADRVGGTDQHQ